MEVVYIVRSLVWTGFIYGAEGRTFFSSAELCIYRRMLRISWTEHRTDQKYSDTAEHH